MVEPGHAPEDEVARRRRLSVDEVFRMVDAGILDEDDRVELIEGELWEMTPQGPFHSHVKGALHDRLAAAYASKAHIRNQDPVVVQPDSIPEPDLAVVRGSRSDYRDRHPVGTDLLLAVEVTASSHTRDRRKARVYARAGVQIYWLVDLEARRVTVFSRPDRDRGEYLAVLTCAEHEELDVPDLDLRWSVASIVA
jgi:Uma2 family endonuclease